MILKNKKTLYIFFSILILLIFIITCSEGGEDNSSIVDNDENEIKKSLTQKTNELNSKEGNERKTNFEKVISKFDKNINHTKIYKYYDIQLERYYCEVSLEEEKELFTYFKVFFNSAMEILKVETYYQGEIYSAYLYYYGVKIPGLGKKEFLKKESGGSVDLTYYYFYDEFNQLKKIEMRNPKDELLYTKVLFYDMVGLLIRRDHYYYFDRPRLEGEYDIELLKRDDDGKVIEIRGYIGENLDEFFQYEYNNFGFAEKRKYVHLQVDTIKESTRLNLINDHYFLAEKITFDEREEIVDKKIYYEKTGFLDEYNLYFYDENGYLIRKEVYFGNHELEEKVFYDKLGNVIKKEQFNLE